MCTPLIPDNVKGVFFIAKHNRFSLFCLFDSHNVSVKRQINVSVKENEMNIGKENEYIEFKKSTSLIKEGLQSVAIK